MPTEILGLPLHPLAVHLPVVLVPLSALVVIGYVLIPRIRAVTGWALLALSLAAPVVVFIARLSGQQLADTRLAEVAGSPDVAADTARTISHHSQYGDVLLWLVLASTVLSWFFTAVVSGRLATMALNRGNHGLAGWRENAAGSRRAVVATLGAVMIVLAAVSVWYAVRAGHTGAEMIWGD
jgi:uncharacterized membrane protein